MTASARPAWTVVMPVKTLSTAKSRMDPDGGGAGGILALAFFRDTATAVLACRRVGEVVVAHAAASAEASKPANKVFVFMSIPV